ncbi:MAG: ABC transporter ATP-binding protein [Gaiellales bacterium]
MSIAYGEGRDEVTAVSGFDLSVQEGQFLCLLGPSGCGKSTVLKAVAGLLAPRSGHITIDHDRLNEQDRIMVWQEATLMPWRTILANVMFPLELQQVPRRDAREKSMSALEALGIADFARKFPRQLSGGMKQRAGIARALVADPQVLLMDEPFAALDAQTRRLLQDRLLELWNNLEKTVVFVTHSVEEAILLGDRIVVMTARPGSIKADITVPFSRPRHHTIRLDREYTRLEGQIWELLQTEAERTEMEAS